VTLQMNAGLLVDLPQLSESGASGHRPVPHRTAVHDRLDHAQGRRAGKSLPQCAAMQAGGKPVTFRTLDIGGDKVVPYFRSAEEENPALGWRAIRLSLDRPGIAAHPAAGAAEGRGRRRAQADAADDHRGQRTRLAGANCSTRKSGISRASATAADAACSSARCWKCPPAVAARRVDGGGGLRLRRLQRPVPVHHGVDRGNSRSRRSFRPVGPAVPAGVAQIVEAADSRHAADAVRRDCRQAAFGHGACSGSVIRDISMSPAAIGPVKSMLLSLDLANSKKSLLPRLKYGKWQTVCEFLTRLCRRQWRSLAFRNNALA
jgi:phosphotransferase system enzyme I (PtsP)